MQHWKILRFWGFWAQNGPKTSKIGQKRRKNGFGLLKNNSEFFRKFFEFFCVLGGFRAQNGPKTTKIGQKRRKNG
ncbi:hypothetical protein, partial [Klebsiella pneumoniae]|uniref:hypothetical protein n=1 Tax=Klebsiella pneumoniae TaxID=573 RepID=UPI001C12CE84